MYEIEFYEDKDGKSEIADFIKAGDKTSGWRDLGVETPEKQISLCIL